LPGSPKPSPNCACSAARNSGGRRPPDSRAPACRNSRPPGTSARTPAAPVADGREAGTTGRPDAIAPVPAPASDARREPTSPASFPAIPYDARPDPMIMNWLAATTVLPEMRNDPRQLACDSRRTSVKANRNPPWRSTAVRPSELAAITRYTKQATTSARNELPGIARTGRPATSEAHRSRDR
jgi:hypothetical protein